MKQGKAKKRKKRKEITDPSLPCFCLLLLRPLPNAKKTTASQSISNLNLNL